MLKSYRFVAAGLAALATLSQWAAAQPAPAKPNDLIPGSYLARVFLERIENPRLEDMRMCNSSSMTFAFKGDRDGRTRTAFKKAPDLKCGMMVISGNAPVSGDQWAYDPYTATVQILEFTGIREGADVTVHFGRVE